MGGASAGDLGRFSGEREREERARDSRESTRSTLCSRRPERSLWARRGRAESHDREDSYLPRGSWDGMVASVGVIPI